MKVPGGEIKEIHFVAGDINCLVPEAR